MPRPGRAQSAIFDRQVSDTKLEKMLAAQLETEPAAKEHRAAKKLVRTYIEQSHPELLEDDVENGEGKGWVVCGPFRFKPRKTEREEGEVKIGAGINWSCPVERA